MYHAVHSSRVAAQLGANPGFPANPVASSSMLTLDPELRPDRAAFCKPGWKGVASTSGLS